MEQGCSHTEACSKLLPGVAPLLLLLLLLLLPLKLLAHRALPPPLLLAAALLALVEVPLRRYAPSPASATHGARRRWLRPWARRSVARPPALLPPVQQSLLDRMAAGSKLVPSSTRLWQLSQAQRRSGPALAELGSTRGKRCRDMADRLKTPAFGLFAAPAAQSRPAEATRPPQRRRSAHLAAPHPGIAVCGLSLACSASTPAPGNSFNSHHKIVIEVNKD